MNRFSGLSVKASLTLVSGILVVGMCSLAAVNSFSAWREQQTAGIMRTNNEISDSFLEGAGSWAAERGTVNTALAAADPATPQTLTRITELRTAADAAFELALARTAAASGGREPAAAAAARSDFAALKKLRSQVDDQLSEPRAGRNSEIVAAWAPTVTTLIMSSQQLRLSSLTIPETALARAQYQQEVRQAVWVMSEYAGRERALVGSIISSGKPFDVAQIRDLAAHRARLEQSWIVAENYAAQPFADPDAVAAIANAKAAVFGRFEQVRHDVFAAGSSDGRYALEAQAWVEEATLAIDSLLLLSEKLSDATRGYTDMAAEDSARALAVNVAILVLAMLVGAVGMWVAVRRVALPVNELASTMSRLAEGETSVTIPSTHRGDEIGAVAKAVLVFKENMIETDRLRASQEEAKRKSDAERKALMMEMADRFEKTVGGVVNAVTSAAAQLQSTATELSGTAEDTSHRSTTVAAATEQMTQNVQTVAAATEELSASIGEIGKQVTESNRIVAGAVDQAADTNKKVYTLSEAAQKIGNIITLINDIASQTNLLALNATIEAARAGDAGKGFAVVASEVKNLANQTSKATDEIATQIKSMQQSTELSAVAIQEITATISKANEISTAIAAAVEEQDAATQEISRNVQQAATGASDISANIANVTHASQQTSAGSSQVLTAAGDLARNGALLREQVDIFLREIRVG